MKTIFLLLVMVSLVQPQLSSIPWLQPVLALTRFSASIPTKVTSCLTGPEFREDVKNAINCLEGKGYIYTEIALEFYTSTLGVFKSRIPISLASTALKLTGSLKPALVQAMKDTFKEVTDTTCFEGAAANITSTIKNVCHLDFESLIQELKQST